MQEWTQEQLHAVHGYLDEVRAYCVGEERFETAALMRDSMKEISDEILGYGSEAASQIIYSICNNHGAVVDCYKKGDEYVITFVFRTQYFQFFLDDFAEYSRLRSRIVDKEKNKKPKK